MTVLWKSLSGSPKGSGLPLCPGSLPELLRHLPHVEEQAGSWATPLMKCPFHTGGWRATIKCLLGANQGRMGNMWKGHPYTVFTPILASLTSKPHLPFLFSLGGWGGAGAEDLHQPRFHTASDFSGTQVGGSSSVMGLEAPGQQGAGAGASWQLLRLSQRKQLILPTRRALSRGRGCLPTISPALINL